MIACITGASSGIGREFARILSKKNYKLILVARNVSALRSLAASLNTRCLIIPCDLADEEACRELALKLKQYNISILINNAGFGDIGDFCETSLTKELDMIDVNVKAAHILTKAVLPKMTEKNYGFIMNVASSAGLLYGGPYMSTYYATKSYLVSLTGAIAYELKAANSRVHICALCPGPVDTGFNDAANVKFSLKGISASYCASYGLRGMFNRKTVIVPTLKMKLAVIAQRFLPRNLSLAITARQQQKKIG